MIGQTVSHYRILERLGGGGMGIVYSAEDTTLHRTVALKFLPPALSLDPEAQERFIHEARAASALDHPAICTIHDIGRTSDGQMFIVMACYEGATLKKTIDEGPLGIDRALEIAAKVSEGLARAHEAGIIHRDIKPANIFITSHCDVKILDFGLAKLSGLSMLTRSGTTLGTAAYMSPEQARSEAVDHRTDIWSLGVVLYEMLTGHRPFESEYDQALVYAILNEEPKPLRQRRPEVPEVVEQIVTKALSKQLEDRYQTVEELLSDLTIARRMETSGGTIAASDAAKRTQKKKLRRGLVVAGLAAIVLAAGSFVAIPLIQDQALASHPRAIAFISLENMTGDVSLEYLRSVLPDVLGSTLGDSKYFRVTRADRMRELMKQIGKDTVEFIDRETGRQLCKRAGIDVMGVGSYTKAGPLFLAELQLIDVHTGERVGSPMKARGREVESFLKEDGIVEDLARQISRGMGISKIGAQATVKPVAEVSSSSLEAQMYYQRGRREDYEADPVKARHFLELAVKEDSTFAIAWYWLGNICSRYRDRSAASFAFAQAVKNASRATERERFQIAEIDSSLRRSLLTSKGYEVAGNDGLSFLKARCALFPFDAEFRFSYASSLRVPYTVTQAIAEYEKTLQLDPAFGPAYNDLGYCYAFLGQGDKGMQALERYAELLPGSRDPINSMTECLLIMGRYDEAITRGQKALQVSDQSWYDQLTLARLYFMKEEYDEALSWSARASKMDAAKSWNLQIPVLAAVRWHAWYLFWAGRLREAEQTLQKLEREVTEEYRVQKLAKIDSDKILGDISWLRTWYAYEKGDWTRARLHLSNWARLTDSKWAFQFCFALLDLQQGRMDSVGMRLTWMRDTLRALSRTDPARTQEYEDNSRTFGNALEAAHLLATHHAAEVVPNWTLRRYWGANIPDSLTTASWPLYAPWGARWGAVALIQWIPLPFDIVPRAYMERGMIDSAIATYELTVKKPAHWLGPIIPRYYYRLARLYEEKGLREKAIENYTQFLKVWGKADPVYTEPADARARLARLKKFRS